MRCEITKSHTHTDIPGVSQVDLSESQTYTNESQMSHEWGGVDEQGKKVK